MTLQKHQFEKVDTAVFYDVDRCMYDTKAGFDLVAKITGDVTSYSTEELLSEYMRYKRLGRSFNYVSSINERLGKATYQDIVEPAFIDAAADVDLRMPAATELLKHADAIGMPVGFLTYGDASHDHSDHAWIDAYDGQIGKGRAARFTDYPYKVVDEIRKGDVFSSWVYPEDPKYLLVPKDLSPWDEPYLLEHALFVDDKTTSFIGIPEHVTGIHVAPEDEENIIAAQAGYLPSAVASVRGLREALGAQKMFAMQHAKGRR